MVINAFNINPNQGPVLTDKIMRSRINGLYEVSINIRVTMVFNLEGKSCLDHNQTRVADTIC